MLQKCLTHLAGFFSFAGKIFWLIFRLTLVDDGDGDVYLERGFLNLC